MPQKNRRKFSSHIVNAGLRRRLVLDDMVFALIAALAAIGILYYLSNREIGDTLWSAHLSIKETRELLHTGVLVAGAVTFVAVLLFGFWSVLDAHRIAGPMHRTKRLLDEIADGNLTHEIQFRKGDEFQDIALSADAMVESHAARISAISALINQVEVAVEDKKDVSGLIGQLKQELAFFKLPEPAN